MKISLFVTAAATSLALTFAEAPAHAAYGYLPGSVWVLPVANARELAVLHALSRVDEPSSELDIGLTRMRVSRKLTLVDEDDDLDPETIPCGTLIDQGLRLEWLESDAWGDSPEARIEPNGHFDKSGAWIDYEQIGRKPSRPESYEAYRYPIEAFNGFSVASGYDLDKPDAEQRRGKMNAVGHGGVDLPQLKGTPVHLLALERQVGDAEVIYVGRLMGESVVTKHTLREGGKRRDYVVIFGHLDDAAPEIYKGRRVRAGEVVGYVGDTDSPDFVHLHLEARRVKDGVDVSKLVGLAITAREATTVTDPRNVLPLKKKPRPRTSRCAEVARSKWIGGYLGDFKLHL